MIEKATEMDGDLRARVVKLEHDSAAQGQRMSAMEAWQRQRDIDSARHDEKWNGAQGCRSQFTTSSRRCHALTG